MNEWKIAVFDNRHTLKNKHDLLVPLCLPGFEQTRVFLKSKEHSEYVVKSFTYPRQGAISWYQ